MLQAEEKVARLLCQILREEDSDVAIELIDRTVALETDVSLGDTCTTDESCGSIVTTAGIYGAFLHSCMFALSR